MQKKEMTWLDKLAKEAAKWWADRLDGTEDCIILPMSLKQQISNSPLDKKFMAVFEKMKAEIEKDVAKISKEQRKLFEENLIKEIKKQYTEHGHLILYTDEEGARGTLGLVALQSNINNKLGNRFPITTDMFIGNGKIELRHCDDDPFYTMVNLSLEDDMSKN